MSAYDGVILKRLRFKGEPDVPEISPAAVGLSEPEKPESMVPASTGKNDAIDGPAQIPEAIDDRTEAEKRFEQKTASLEQQRLRAAAAATYRDQKFNDRLAKEPEHYDLFKVSFTK